MSDSKYHLQSLSRALDVMELVEASGDAISLTEIANTLDEATPIIYRVLQTLESRGYLHRRPEDKRYIHTGRSTGSGSVRRAVDLLQVVSASSPQGALRWELARTSGLDEAVVDELVAPLLNKGLIEEDAFNGRLHLSYSLLGIVRPLLNGDDVTTVVRPLMESLHRRTEETVSLFRLAGNRQVVSAVIPSRQPVRYVLDVGSAYPLHLGAGGKAALAAMFSESVDRILQEEQLEQLTSHRTDVESLMQEVDVIRARDYAVSTGERVEGASAVAASIRDDAGEARGVLGLMMPSIRASNERLHSLGELLVQELRNLHIPSLSSASVLPKSGAQGD